MFHPKRIVAPFRPVTDVYNGNVLTIAAALKMADSHFEQAILWKPGSRTTLICVAQAVKTYPGADGLQNLAHTNVMFPRGVIKGEDLVGITKPILSDIWVARMGRTSVTSGYSFTTPEGKCIASVKRVHVQVRDGKPVPWTNADREMATMDNPGEYSLPVIEEIPSGIDLAAFDTGCLEKSTTIIGPHHCNHTHVDHAALAELTLQGFFISGVSYEGRKCSFHYRYPAQKGQVVSCWVHKNLKISLLYGKMKEDKNYNLLLVALLDTISGRTSSL